MQYCLANWILNSSNQMCTKMYFGWDQILLLAFEKFSSNLSWEFKFGFKGSEQSASKFNRLAGKRHFLLFFIFIGPESDHWECLSLTNSMTHSLTH